VTDPLLEDQIAYYRARAGEYDEWFLRQGRYDRGPHHRQEWFAEVGKIRSELILQIPHESVLEFACGTGLWTQLLAEHPSRVVAVDASPEVIAQNRHRLNAPHVEYVNSDIFSWITQERFKLIFFSFWLSHVPSERFDQFWNSVQERLARGGRVFFVDSLLEQDSTAKDHAPLNDSGVVRRRLNDGREFDIVKVFYEPATLLNRLRAPGWQGDVRAAGRFFLFGSVVHVD
jgi:2-polyprenyl-3-methyl-5-hydroxy-6-metoxy-1,4-benzoquinol methylase